MLPQLDKPLLGKLIVVTRTPQQASELIDMLKKFGAAVENLPCIRIESLDAAPLLRQMLVRHRFDWIFFTSANAASEFGALLRRIDIAVPAAVRIAAIGKKTAYAAQDAGFEIDFVAKAGTSGEFIAQFFAAGLHPKHVLYPTSRLADNRLETLLASHRVDLTRLNVYHTVSAVNESDLRRLFRFVPDAVVFYSPSAVRYFFEALPTELRHRMHEVQFAALGEITAEVLNECGIEVPLVAETPVTTALVDALVHHFSNGVFVSE